MSELVIFVDFFRVKVLQQNTYLTFNPNIGGDFSGFPYPFGMDPVSILQSSAND